jgi:hypothetical protein
MHHTGIDTVNEPVWHLYMQAGTVVPRPRSVTELLHLPPKHLVIHHVTVFPVVTRYDVVLIPLPCIGDKPFLVFGRQFNTLWIGESRCYRLFSRRTRGHNRVFALKII